MPERLTRPDRSLGEDLGRDDADVGLPRREHAGAVGPDQRHPVSARELVEPQHLVHRDALGDADDRLQAGVDRLVERVGSEAGGHEGGGGVGARLGDGLAHGVEDRNPLDLLAAVPRCGAGDYLGPVGAVAQGVEGALAPGQVLDDEAGGLVDDDRHRDRAFAPLSRKTVPQVAVAGEALASSSSTRSAVSPLQPQRESQTARALAIDHLFSSISSPAAAQEFAPLLQL